MKFLFYKNYWIYNILTITRLNFRSQSLILIYLCLVHTSVFGLMLQSNVRCHIQKRNFGFLWRTSNELIPLYYFGQTLDLSRTWKFINFFVKENVQIIKGQKTILALILTREHKMWYWPLQLSLRRGNKRVVLDHHKTMDHSKCRHVCLSFIF